MNAIIIEDNGEDQQLTHHYERIAIQILDINSRNISMMQQENRKIGLYILLY